MSENETTLFYKYKRFKFDLDQLLWDAPLEFRRTIYAQESDLISNLRMEKYLFEDYESLINFDFYESDYIDS